MSKRKKFERYHGCDEDCFNCKYSDCRKGVGKIKTDKAAEYWQRQGQRDFNTSSRTYTVEIKGNVLRGLVL